MASTRGGDIRESAPTGARSDVRVRRASAEDVDGIHACQAAAYAQLPRAALCDRRPLRMQLGTFPDGQLVALAGGRIVGYAMSLITVQLFSTMPDTYTARQAIVALADMTDRYRELFRQRARKAGLFIVAGSYPAPTSARPTCA
jgi:hypothetical protein